MKQWIDCVKDVVTQKGVSFWYGIKINIDKDFRKRRLIKKVATPIQEASLKTKQSASRPLIRRVAYHKPIKSAKCESDYHKKG